MKNVFTILILVFAIMLISFCSTPKRGSLFNGKNLDGWEIIKAEDSLNQDQAWSVRDGVIYCKGAPKGYICTTTEYSNFILYLDWRWVDQPGNSGVLLHAQKPDQVWPQCIECQLKNESAGDFVLIGTGAITVAEQKHENPEGFLVIPKMAGSSEKTVGEWNNYKIISKDGSITCYVNDVLQNDGSNASLTKGNICLQSEGAPIEFKNIVIEILDDSK